MKKQAYRSKLMQKRAMAGYIFCIPLLIGIAFIFLPNLIMGIQFSLNDIVQHNDGTWTLSAVGIKHYSDILSQRGNFYIHFGSTMRTFLTQVPVLMIFSLFISVLLNSKFRGRTVARAIFFIPVILATGIIAAVEDTSGIIATVESTTVDTGAIAQEMGSIEITKLLTSMNFPDFLIEVVSGAIASIYTVVKSSGMQIFIFLAGLQEIPISLYEAAEVEGCSKWELFWKITFPMISPQIAVNLIYTIVDVCSDTESPLFTWIYGRAFQNNMFGEGMAAYMIYLAVLAVILVIVFLVLSKFVKSNSAAK